MNCRYASAVTLKLILAKYAAAGPAASGAGVADSCVSVT